MAGPMIVTCVLRACSYVPDPIITGRHGADGSRATPGHVGIEGHRAAHRNIEALDS